MYRLFPLLFLFFLFSCDGSREHSGNDKSGGLNDTVLSETAVIEFEKTEYQIGKVIQGEKVGCQFVFRNTGTADLMIRDARASCGCTVPQWEKKPVKPGETGRLEVMFDSSGRMGTQKKSVTVVSNAETQTSKLMIIAEVVAGH